MNRKMGLIIAVFMLAIFVTPIATSAFSFGSGEATVIGTVKDSSGNPLSSVKVTLKIGSTVHDTDYTDTNGNYDVTCSISSKTYVTVTYSKSGYTTQTYSTYLYPYYFKLHNEVLSLNQGLKGNVKSSTGTNLNSALVKLFVNGIQKGSDYTDSYGNYKIPYLVSSTTFATIEITKSDYDTTTASVYLGAGTYTTKNVQMQSSTSSPNTYALIVAGHTDHRFGVDTISFVDTLREEYQVPISNMYILIPAITQEGLPGMTFFAMDLYGPQAIVDAANWIASKSTASDNVIVWWTGHGIVDLFSCPEYASGITANELDNALDTITCDNMMIFLGPCHSGSFIDNLDDESNRAIYTSCDSDEVGYASGDRSMWPYAIHQGLDSEGEAFTADSNSDGRVSLTELFSYSIYYVQTVMGYTDQNPQSSVGTAVAASLTYFGDWYY
ncbi:MAG: C13 family peptidase [Candidatus Thorarchaeota archaeon]